MKLIRPLTINDAALTSSNVAETDYSAYNAGTTYALGDRCIVVSADVHQVYESLQAANTGHTPASSPTWWLLVGKTNRWKMFDGSPQSQSAQATSIDVVLATTERIDSVWLGNINATTARVTFTVPIDGLVYDSGSVNMVADSGITDWWAYFFEPIVRITDKLFADIPPYGAGSLEIIVADAAAAIGECVVGLSKEIGDTEYGIKVGIQDYSIKQADQFGNYNILERAFAKTGGFTVWVDNRFVDALQTLLAAYRATPILYVGVDSYGSTAIYGFFKDFDVAIRYPTQSICNIEIEGIT